MMRNEWCLLAVVCMVLAGAPRGYAGPVTVNITGQVTSSDHAGIPVGSLVTGSYTYDDAATPALVFTDPDRAFYSIDGLTLAFADGSAVTSSNPRLQLTDYAAPGPFSADRYIIYHGGITSATGSFAGGIVSGGIGWSDPTCTAFNGSLAIPDPAHILAMFPDSNSGIFLDFEDDPWYRDVFFTITGLSVASPTVPVPGAVLLGAFGAGLAGWLRRRRTL